jgi:uroporphyrinogen decarboxylase
MQTGTLDQIRESAEHALTWGKQGAGYIFCTSNVAFKGMELDRYLFILDIWRDNRRYDV